MYQNLLTCSHFKNYHKYVCIHSTRMSLINSSIIDKCQNCTMDLKSLLLLLMSTKLVHPLHAMGVEGLMFTDNTRFHYQNRCIIFTYFFRVKNPSKMYIWILVHSQFFVICDKKNQNSFIMHLSFPPTNSSKQQLAAPGDNKNIKKTQWQNIAHIEQFNGAIKKSINKLNLIPTSACIKEIINQRVHETNKKTVRT